MTTRFNKTYKNFITYSVSPHNDKFVNDIVKDVIAKLRSDEILVPLKECYDIQFMKISFDTDDDIYVSLSYVKYDNGIEITVCYDINFFKSCDPVLLRKYIYISIIQELFLSLKRRYFCKLHKSRFSSYSINHNNI